MACSEPRGRFEARQIGVTLAESHRRFGPVESQSGSAFSGTNLVE